VPPGGYAPPPGGYGPPPGVPAAPGASGAFSPGDAINFAWERIKADPGTIIGAIIVASLLMGVVFTVLWVVGGLVQAALAVATTATVGAGRHRVPDPAALPISLGFSIVGLVVQLVTVIIILPVVAYFSAGIVKFTLKVVRGEPYAFGDVFSGGPHLLPVLVAVFIAHLAAGLGFVLLVVPGVIISLGLSMAVPLIVDRGLGPIDALGESWKLTDGNRLNLFIYWLIAFGLSIAGGCACGLGFVVVNPLILIGWIYIYARLTGQPLAAVARAPAVAMSPGPGYGAPPQR
jgi:uncharacterized membrane protein